LCLIPTSAHCLHNIGLLFDMKEEYHRSLPHYDEALKIKNVIAGFSSSESPALLAPASVNENVSLALRSSEEDLELPQVTKATLSVAMTHKKMASIYAKVSDSGLSLNCVYCSSSCFDILIIYFRKSAKQDWACSLPLHKCSENS
jgi:hypothetical protein